MVKGVYLPVHGLARAVGPRLEQQIVHVHVPRRVHSDRAARALKDEDTLDLGAARDSLVGDDLQAYLLAATEAFVGYEYVLALAVDDATLTFI